MDILLLIMFIIAPVPIIALLVFFLSGDRVLRIISLIALFLSLAGGGYYYTQHIAAPFIAILITFGLFFLFFDKNA